MKDQDTKQRFVELRAQNRSYDFISKELSVSKQTLVTWSKELSLQIMNMREIDLEATREEWRLLKKQRVELLGEKLKAIKEALEKRDLADVSTERLFDLLFKTYGLVEREAGDPVFQEETVDLLDSFTRVKRWNA